MSTGDIRVDPGAFDPQAASDPANWRDLAAMTDALADAQAALDRWQDTGDDGLLFTAALRAVAAREAGERIDRRTAGRGPLATVALN